MDRGGQYQSTGVSPGGGISVTKKTAWVQASEADKARLAEARSQTLWQALAAAAAIDPAHDALVGADDAGDLRRLSYGELLERAAQFSGGLASIGVKRGDRVVLWMTNRLEWVISWLAAVRIGAVVVPVNTFLKPPEVAYCIAQSGARHLICMDRFRRLDMLAVLDEICPEFGAQTAPGALASRSLPDLRNIVVFPREGTVPAGAHDWHALAASGAQAVGEADRMAAAVTPDDLIMVKYTSGSTGFPKGVMLQHGGWVACGLLHAERTGMLGSDVYFSMMPFFHAGGSLYGLMSMLLRGGTLVFTEAFDTALGVKLIAQERATIFVSALGKEVVMAAFDAGLTFPSIRLAHVHNDAARVVMPNATFAFSPFGLTETYGPCSITGPDDPAECQMVTSGLPLPGNEIRVVDPETGEDVGPGVVGEALIRGNTMVGYWNKPEETARALDADGWFHSEDLVSVDEAGFVRFCGRIKLMAKVGGENVSLEEVERVICAHEAVTHCATVQVADARKVEALRAYVVRRADMALSDAELLGWLKPRLAHFKLPREIAFVEALPRLGNEKLDRSQLREWAKEELAT